MRDGCGPLEKASQPSTLPTIDPTLPKLATVDTTFGSAAGTVVLARGGELWLVAADGRHQRRLVRGASPADDRPHAHWSPSGDALAFVTHHGGGGRVVLLSPSCSWARVLGPADHWTAPRFSADGLWLLGGSSQKAIHLLSGTWLPPPPCSGRCVDEPGDEAWLRVRESNTRSVDVARPTWKTTALDRTWSSALTPDGRTLYAFVRFRASSAEVLTDFSPIFRVRLPSTLPEGKTKPFVPEYFAPGFTTIREGWLSVSPDGKHLFALGESGLVGPDQPRADVQWIATATAKTTALGARHKLVGPRSWITDAQWSPDGSKVLLTVAACAGERSDDAPYCSDLRHELVLADQNQVAFLAHGSRASWTAASILTTPT